MPLLFVYGTLRTPIGGPSADTHYHHRIAGSIRHRRSAWLERASLYDFGAYPGVGPGAGTVLGEVFDIDDDALRQTDHIESHPEFYERKLVTVLTHEGPVEAWVYYAPASLTEGHPVVPSGNWFDRDRVAAAAPPIKLPDDPVLADVLARISAEECSWVSTVRPDGRPHSVPIWHVRSGNRFYLISPSESVKTQNLRSNPAIVLALPDPIEVVIIEGWAIEAPGAMAGVRDLFDSKYGWDPGIEAEGSQAVLEVTPRRITTWSGEGDVTQWVV